MEVFSCKTKIISGCGAISSLKELESKRLLLVADPYFEKTVVPGIIKNAVILGCGKYAEIWAEEIYSENDENIDEIVDALEKYGL